MQNASAEGASTCEIARAQRWTRPPPPKFRLLLLGRFELTGPDGPVDLPNKKLAGLLAYLACTAPGRSRREKLATLLWGSHFEAQARQNLRQALFRLRAILGQEAVISNSEKVALASGAMACDVAKFEVLFPQWQPRCSVPSGRPLSRHSNGRRHDPGRRLDGMAHGRMSAARRSGARRHAQAGRIGTRSRATPIGLWPLETGDSDRQSARGGPPSGDQRAGGCGTPIRRSQILPAPC